MAVPRDPGKATLLHRARDYATQAHRRIDQRRKYSGQPYEVHLKAVADRVAAVIDEEEVIAAAWLHDTVEDTPATLEDIEREFGPRVARLVADLTDVSRPGDGNRAARKSIDRTHLAQASPRAKSVKLADLADNCRDICAHDKRFARVYLVEMAALLEVLGDGHERLYQQAQTELQKCADRLELAVRAPEQLPAARDLDELSDVDLELATRHQRSLRLFMQAFSAEDVAEPLRSFDADGDAGSMARAMRERDLAVASLRQDGLASGFALAAELEHGACHAYLRRFKKDQVIEGDASLADVVHVLTRHDYCFVRILDDISGVIGRGDMQKPIVRMWLFGFVTFIEMYLRERILLRWPDDAWTDQLPAARLDKARALRAERQRRGQTCHLLDCVQISDQAHILLEIPEERIAFGFDSKAAARRVIKEFESLRNNLAHAQDIVTHDWAQIARMSARMDSLAKGL